MPNPNFRHYRYRGRRRERWTMRFTKNVVWGFLWAAPVVVFARMLDLPMDWRIVVLLVATGFWSDRIMEWRKDA